MKTFIDNIKFTLWLFYLAVSVGTVVGIATGWGIVTTRVIVRALS